MRETNLLAVDLGASNGRVVLGAFGADGLHVREMHRFENRPQTVNGVFYWDYLRLMHEVGQGILRCKEAGETVDSIGVCSWGNTVGLLDSSGDLMMNPVHYRDAHYPQAAGSLNAVMDERARFGETLYNTMVIQPAVFMHHLRESKPWMLEHAAHVLMISDLFNWALTGVRASELTMAATSQLVDMRTMEWNRPYMQKLGLRPQWFPDLVRAGASLGTLNSQIVDELGLPHAPQVIAVAGHDTAGAAFCLPDGPDEDSLYLSCGTWSCMGCRVPAPIESSELPRIGITNDVGVQDRHHLRFNHTGLWILQECRRAWGILGRNYTWEEIARLAGKAPPLRSVIDSEAELFFSPGDMPGRVREFCRATGQPIPESDGAVARAVLEGLALRYRYSANRLEAASGLRFSRLHLIGGGARNELLAQMTADALARPVHTGPAEATVLGNLLVQALALGVINTADAGRQEIFTAFPPHTLLPRCTAPWDAAALKWIPVFGWR